MLHSRHAARTAVLAALLPCLPGPASFADEAFVRGDLNRDGQVTLADASSYFDWRFLGAEAPGCLDALDVNNDGNLDSAGTADLDLLLDWLFRTAPAAPLPVPFPLPGVDSTADGLTCLAPAAPDPPSRDRDFVLGWDTPRAVKVGSKDVEFFLQATTARSIACASVAYRVDKAVLENVRVDLRSTIVPARVDVTFRSLVLPSMDPGYHLLLAGVVYVVPFGAGYTRAPVAAAEGPLRAAPVFRVLADVRADAPLGARKLFTPAVKDDFWVAGRFLHGIQNEVGFPGEDLPGSSSSLAVAQDDEGTILSDGEEFFRGDTNFSQSVDISDALSAVNFLFLGAPEPPCIDAGDANDDGLFNIADAIFTLGFLFQGTAAPPHPGPSGDCDYDLTLDMLTCDAGCP